MVWRCAHVCNMPTLTLRQEEFGSLSHLGEHSSASHGRSILAVLTSRRLSWSASGRGAGGSSSSSWVGCREHSMVSSVMQLEVESTGNTFTIRPIHIWRSFGDQTSTKTKPGQKKSPPGDAAAPRDFGGVASEPGVGVTRGGFSRRGRRRGQRFGEVLLRGERVLTGHPVLIELLHTLLAHLFALASRRQATHVLMLCRQEA